MKKMFLLLLMLCIPFMSVSADESVVIEMVWSLEKGKDAYKPGGFMRLRKDDIEIHFGSADSQDIVGIGYFAEKRYGDQISLNGSIGIASVDNNLNYFQRVGIGTKNVDSVDSEIATHIYMGHKNQILGSVGIRFRHEDQMHNGQTAIVEDDHEAGDHESGDHDRGHGNEEPNEDGERIDEDNPGLNHRH